MLDELFTVTHFFDHGARQLQERQYSLTSLAETIEAKSDEAKTLLPWLKFAHFGNLTSDKSCLRHDANVLWITGCEGDYDGMQMSFDEARDALREHAIACILHTSPSHTPDKPRWRVLAPCSKHCAKEDRAKLVARLNGALGGVLGAESFTLSQSYLYGHLDGAVESRVEALDGRYIDLCDELDAIAIGKPGTKKPTDGGGNGHHDPDQPTDITELTRRILSGESLHPSVLAIAGHYAGRGDGKLACTDYLGLAFVAAHVPRYGGRWDECCKVIDWVYEQEAKKQQPPPKALLALANLLLDGIEVPKAEWAVFNRIPLRQVCLLSGHGAVGKSTIALQLACAHGLGRDWLGSVAALGGALYIDCEDDFAAIHYRLEAIRKFYGVSYQELVESGLEVLPMAGLECVMAVANAKTGTVTPTPFYSQVLERAGDLKHINVLIANASNVFAGNEVDRSQVQQFIGLLKRITNASGGSVTLISHSSLAGLATETGLSGSTQWHNAVRARMWMHAAKTNGADHQPEGDIRALDFMKNQYGKTDDSVVLRWRNGLFLPDPKPSSYEIAAREAKADIVFLTVLKRFNDSRRNVSHLPTARNYAPKQMVEEQECKDAKLTVVELGGAMRRLFAADRIKVARYGSPSRGWERLEET